MSDTKASLASDAAAGSTENAVRSTLQFSTIPLALRLLLMALGAFVPFEAYMSLGAMVSFSSSTASVIGWNLWFGLAASFVTIASTALGLRFSGTTCGVYVFGLLGSIAALVAWYTQTGMSVFVAMYLPYAAWVMWRNTKLAAVESVAERARREFRQDSIVLVIAIPLYLLAQAGVATEHTAATNFAVPVVTFLYATLRIYGLWSLERMETRTNVSARSGLVILLLLAVIIAYIGPAVLKYSFMAALAVSVLGAIVGIVLAPLLALIHPHGQKPQTQPPGPPIKHILPKTSGHTVTHAATSEILLIVGVLLAIAVIWFLFRRKQELTKQTGEQEVSTEEIVRAWIPTRGGLRLLSTSHPVRQAVQAWLNARHKAGETIEPHLTIRQMLQNPSSEVEHPAISLDEYDAARYNLSDDAAKRQP